MKDASSLVQSHKLFTPLECQHIKDLALRWPVRDAATYNRTGSKYDEVIRSGKVAFLQSKERNIASKFDVAMHHKIIEAVEAYARLTNIDISILDYSYQFTRYEKYGDHFELHSDQSVDAQGFNVFANEHMQRKISVTIELDPPEAYEGCKVYFDLGAPDAALTRFHREQGSITIFPSWLRHQVTPLTSGTRYSMVVWFGGPWWK